MITAKLDEITGAVISVRFTNYPYTQTELIAAGLVEVEGYSLEYLSTAYFDGAAFVPRPETPELVKGAGGYSMENLPEGTVFTVTDLSDGEAIYTTTSTPENHAVEFSLPDAGRYQIAFETAGLYMDRTYILEVNSA
ncbi:hypothetical protein [Falsihalocynthiibacter arcticus]|uniref:hypothetical protein n=1 Tax=Falsihalocynthiibacter arcticus TaxID=1579316 RepID=UPI003002EFC9